MYEIERVQISGYFHGSSKLIRDTCCLCPTYTIEYESSPPRTTSPGHQQSHLGQPLLLSSRSKTPFSFGISIELADSKVGIMYIGYRRIKTLLIVQHMTNL